MPSTRIEENIKRLAAFGVPVVFVWGNNDYEVRQHKLYSIFKAHGVITLRNESVPFTYNGHTIAIAGVDDIRMEMDHYEEAIKELDKGKLNILICHNPEIHEQINEADGIDAIFSGHTTAVRLGLENSARMNSGKQALLKMQRISSATDMEQQKCLFV